MLAALVVGYELHPLDASAPMVVEAQWDRPNVPARAARDRLPRTHYDGETIMASMGSLGHYMQEASQRADSTIRDFLHEGNGDIWLAALNGPRPYAGWVLIEEKAEGGDMLARNRAREPALSGWVLARLRRCGPRALSASGIDRMLNVRQVVESAEIDFRSRESLIARQIGLGRLIPDLAADRHRSDRHRHAAEHDRTDLAAAAPRSCP